MTQTPEVAADSTRHEDAKRRDAAAYDTLPESYINHVHRISGPIIEEICTHAKLHAGECVLDVGSGAGAATERLAEQVGESGEALGIDHSQGLVDLASARARANDRTRSLPVRYQTMDAEDLKLEDRSFDVVVSFSAIFHFPNPQRAVNEMFRVLRPGGRLVLSFTAVRPVAFWARLVHVVRRVGGRLLSPIRPVLFAPASLGVLADKYLAELDVPAEPTWTQQDRHRQIRQFLRAAGFEIVQETFTGRDFAFSSAEDFYEAQLMISSDLRIRASAAPEHVVAAMRREFVDAAEHTLARGGRLLYPFGAVVVSATKPS